MDIESTLLIVDDEEDTRELIRNLLKHEPVSVIDAPSGEDALVLLEQNASEIDLILLDVMMPGLDGFEVLSILKANPITAGIKVIMLTAMAQTREKVQAFSAGASDYITKPFDQQELVARINSQSCLRRSEKALKASEDRYRDLFENASDLIQSVDPNGRFNYVNHAWLKTMGYGRDEVTSLCIEDIIHPECYLHCMERFNQLLSGEPVPRVESTFVTKDGRPVEVEGSLSCRFEAGMPVATRGIFRDVTKNKQASREIIEKNDELRVVEEELREANLNLEEKVRERTTELEKANIRLQKEIQDRTQAEQAVRESEQKYREVVERADDGICIIQDGLLKYVNPHSLAVIGYTAEEILDTPMVAYVHPDAIGVVAENYRKRMTGEVVSSRYESILLHKSGDSVDVEIKASIIQYQGAIADLVIIRDITERKQAQASQQTLIEAMEERNRIISASHLQLEETLSQLEKANEELRASQAQLLQSEKLAAVGQLVSGVAHELNNPLMAISGYSELLLRQVKDEQPQRNLENMHNNVKRAIAIVRNLLSFSRKQEPQRVFICINDVIESIVQLRAYEMNLDNIKLHTALDPDIPNTMADFQQLQQVFLNIVINAEQAIKDYHETGTISIHTTQEEDMIRISIADDGPGIPPGVVSRIFDPFFTTKEVGKGTGLGLSICYGIIQEHDGMIDVQGSRGDGTAFIIKLPIVAEPATEDESGSVMGGIK